MSDLKLIVKNCKQKNIGKHGLTEKDLCSIDQRLLTAHQKFADQARDYQILVDTTTAWRKAHEQHETINKVKKIAQGVLDDFAAGLIDDVIILGIGGSDLGARALHEALNNAPYYNMRKTRNYPRIFFIGDNSCPEEIEGLLDTISLEKTLVNVISKSGTTPETLANFYIIKEKLVEELGEKQADKHIIATTGENDKSELWVSGHNGPEKKFRDFLPVPDGVGGRFSVFSPVGLFYAAISGLSIDKLMEGLQRAEQRCCSNPLTDTNVAYQLAKILYLEDTLRQKNIIAFFPFDNRLEGLSRWFRQLWAESLGKTVTEQVVREQASDDVVAKLSFSAGIMYKKETASDIRLEGTEINEIAVFRNGDKLDIIIEETQRVTGTTPLAWVGSRDNHSSWQLGSAGPRDKVVVFTRVENYSVDYRIPVPSESKLALLNGKMIGKDLECASEMGTEIDAVNNGIPSITIQLSQKNEKTIAELMYTLEMATAIAGELYEINAFDQPAVEGYKAFTKEILSTQ